MKFFVLLLFGVSTWSRILAQEASVEKPHDPREWWKTSEPMPAEENPEATKLPRVKVEANALINEKGEKLLFRGVSIADPDLLDYHGHWNQTFFEEVKNLGATIVRLPVHPAAWRARTPEKYLVLLDQAVKWSTQLGLYVIIDWHSIGNLRTGLYQDPMYQTSLEETSAFWRTIARRYGKHHTVAFYEIFNEPTTWEGRLGRSTWPEWRATNEDLISLVRANGGEGVPLIAGFDWAYDLSPIIEDPVRAQGIGYVVHPYGNKRSRPWEAKWEENFAFAASRYPVVATEIGFELKKDETITDDHYANRITRFLESHRISWLAWVYDPEWWPSMKKSWGDDELTAPGSFFKETLHRPIAKPR